MAGGTLAVAGALLLSGCLPVSLHPFCREADVIEDPALVGTWLKTNGNDHIEWTFESGPDNVYSVQIKEKEEEHDPVTTAVLHGRLFKLDTNVFLDLTPDMKHLKQYPMELHYKLGMVPGHIVYWIHRTDQGMVFSGLELDWLEKHLKEHPGLTPHYRLGQDDERIVLTAETAGLQEFLKQTLGLKGAWNEMARFQKQF